MCGLFTRKTELVQTRNMQADAGMTSCRSHDLVEVGAEGSLIGGEVLKPSAAVVVVTERAKALRLSILSQDPLLLLDDLENITEWQASPPAGLGLRQTCMTSPLLDNRHTSHQQHSTIGTAAFAESIRQDGTVENCGRPPGHMRHQAPRAPLPPLPDPASRKHRSYPHRRRPHAH